MAKKIPLRQCVGCQQMIAKKDLIRIIKTPEDNIELDVTGKKNGRGAYVCRSLECLNKAIKNKSIERSLKVNVPDDVYESLKKELENLD